MQWPAMDHYPPGEVNKQRLGLLDAQTREKLSESDVEWKIKNLLIM